MGTKAPSPTIPQPSTAQLQQYLDTHPDKAAPLSTKLRVEAPPPPPDFASLIADDEDAEEADDEEYILIGLRDKLKDIE